MNHRSENTKQVHIKQSNLKNPQDVATLGGEHFTELPKVATLIYLLRVCITLFWLWLEGPKCLPQPAKSEGQLQAKRKPHQATCSSQKEIFTFSLSVNCYVCHTTILLITVVPTSVILITYIFFNDAYFIVTLKCTRSARI